MIRLTQYISWNKDEHRFRLPVSFWNKMLLHIWQWATARMPFAPSVYVHDYMPRYYWHIVLRFLHAQYGITFGTRKVLWKSRFLAHVVYISENETGQRKKITAGAADSTSMEHALSRAIGEFLERKVSSATPPRHEVAVMLFADICAQAVVQSTLHRRVPKEQDVDCICSAPVSVVQVEDMIHAQYVWYPVQHVFWNQEHLNEPVLLQATTNGCAGGFSVDEATQSALFEVVERDAFMCYWHTSTSPNVVDVPAGCVAELDGLRELLRESGSGLTVCNITTDIGVPTCLCIAQDMNTKGIVVTSAAAVTFGHAIEKSCREMRQIIGWIEQKRSMDTPRDDVDIEARVTRAASGHYAQDYQFLLKGIHHSYHDASSADSWLSDCVSATEICERVYAKLRVMRAGYDVVYRYVFSDVHARMLGYNVVRVVIPKLYPLYLVESFKIEHSDRLGDFAYWVYGDRSYSSPTAPHPFP